MTKPKGIYVLVVEAHGQTEVGRLGVHTFSGLYAYVGSALGPGGLKRVERHRAVAQGHNPARHWHVDYLLGLGTLEAAFTLETEERLECALARALNERATPSIRGFGSSDCRCPTHLFALPEALQVERFKALGNVVRTLGRRRGQRSPQRRENIA